MTLIDTSMWIEALRVKGDPEARDRVAALLQSGEAAWCPIVRLELWSGVGDARERKVLIGFDDVVVNLPIADDAWNLATKLSSLGRSKGHTFPLPDLVVFACAQAHGADLLHRDKHFDQLNQFSSC